VQALSLHGWAMPHVLLHRAAAAALCLLQDFVVGCLRRHHLVGW
jgi:hypothetical protein